MKNRKSKFKMFTILTIFAASVFACKAGLSPQSATYATEFFQTNWAKQDHEILEDSHSVRRYLFNMLEEIKELCNEKGTTDENVNEKFEQLKNIYERDVWDEQKQKYVNVDFKTDYYNFLTKGNDQLLNVYINFKTELGNLINDANTINEFLQNIDQSKFIAEYGAKKLEELKEIKKDIKEFNIKYNHFNNNALHELENSTRSLDIKLKSAFAKSSLNKHYFKTASKDRTNSNWSKLLNSLRKYEHNHDIFKKAYSELVDLTLRLNHQMEQIEKKYGKLKQLRPKNLENTKKSVQSHQSLVLPPIDEPLKKVNPSKESNVALVDDSKNPVVVNLENGKTNDEPLTIANGGVIVNSPSSTTSDNMANKLEKANVVLVDDSKNPVVANLENGKTNDEPLTIANGGVIQTNSVPNLTASPKIALSEENIPEIYDYQIDPKHITLESAKDKITTSQPEDNNINTKENDNDEDFYPVHENDVINTNNEVKNKEADGYFSEDENLNINELNDVQPTTNNENSNINNLNNSAIFFNKLKENTTESKNLNRSSYDIDSDNTLSLLNRGLNRSNSSANLGTKHDINTTTIENNEPELESDEENSSFLDETTKKYGGSSRVKKFFRNIFDSFRKK